MLDVPDWFIWIFVLGAIVAVGALGAVVFEVLRALWIGFGL